MFNHENEAHIVRAQPWQDVRFDIAACVRILVSGLGTDHDKLAEFARAYRRLFQPAHEDGGGLDSHAIAEDGLHETTSSGADAGICLGLGSRLPLRFRRPALQSESRQRRARPPRLSKFRESGHRRQTGSNRLPSDDIGLERSAWTQPSFHSSGSPLNRPTRGIHESGANLV
jgi:hypothetical protein